MQIAVLALVLVDTCGEHAHECLCIVAEVYLEGLTVCFLSVSGPTTSLITA